MAAASTTSRNILVAPENMPEHLTWFKWESYTTWLSGAALWLWSTGPGPKCSSSTHQGELSTLAGDRDLGGLAGRRLGAL
jgi:hypothetical protein